MLALQAPLAPHCHVVRGARTPAWSCPARPA